MSAALGTAVPAVAIGRTALGRLRILEGEVEDGLAQLDEVAALLMTGEVDPLTTGMMLCELVCAAQALGMHDRAREWTDVMERWRHGAAFGAIHGRCRVHRAELLRLSGPADAAEQEALLACVELRPWLRREYGWPLVELGTIRLHRGDLAGAEAAFLEAHRHVWSPQPGLALLRSAQGHHEVALDLISAAVERPDENPSKEQPPFGDLRLAPLLAAQAEIAAAAGRRDLATAAADSLAGIAERFPGLALAAAAQLAHARAALLSDDAAGSRTSAQQAASSWSEVGAPYEAACARLVLAAAHRQAGDESLARMEWEAARQAFTEFGATARVAECDDLLGRDRRGSAPGAVTALTAVFIADGDVRRVGYPGGEVLLPDLKGFRYLERMLTSPGREFHALDLVGAEAGETLVEPGLPVLDEEAKAAYRRRLADVEEDIEDATAANDLGRLALAQRDRDYLIAELTAAVGLGGRVRTTRGSSEKARTSVTRSLRYAIDRLGQRHPELGRHLAGTVRTGTFCSYDPDPLTTLHWLVDGH